MKPYLTCLLFVLCVCCQCQNEWDKKVAAAGEAYETHFKKFFKGDPQNPKLNTSPTEIDASYMKAIETFEAQLTPEEKAFVAQGIDTGFIGEKLGFFYYFYKGDKQSCGETELQDAIAKIGDDKVIKFKNVPMWYVAVHNDNYFPIYAERLLEVARKKKCDTEDCIKAAGYFSVFPKLSQYYLTDAEKKRRENNEKQALAAAIELGIEEDKVNDTMIEFARISPNCYGVLNLPLSDYVWKELDEPTTKE